jgi:dTDP-4-amino-4,6-dideoxygalactose transaminase
MDRSVVTEAWPFWRTVPRFDREYSIEDLRSAFLTLWRTPQDETDWVQELYSPSFRQFARSGTECLYTILKLLKLPEPSRIGVPLYCCSAVFEAIVAAGHVPVFLEIDPEFYSLDREFLRKKRNTLDALVLVHVFGYPNDLSLVYDALQGTQIPVIEDCAHSLFSEYRARPLGSCTDAAFLTFGMHKPAAVGGGALLLVNNPDLARQAKHALPRFDAEARMSEFRHSILCLARSFSYHRAAYGALLASPIGNDRDSGKLTPRIGRTDMLAHSFSPAHIRSVDRVLVARKVREFRRKLAALARNTQKICAALSGSAISTLAEPKFGQWNHFLLPARFSSPERREAARRFLIRRRVDTAPLYQNCARNAVRFGYTGDCPQAECVARTIVTVPNHAWLTDDEVEYIAESLFLSAEQL